MLNHNCGDKVATLATLAFTFFFWIEDIAASFHPLPVFVFLVVCGSYGCACVCVCVIVNTFDVMLWQTRLRRRSTLLLISLTAACSDLASLT